MDNQKVSLQEMVTCRVHITGNGSLRIDRWKFEAIRKAILVFLNDAPCCAVFSDLVQAVERLLGPDLLKKFDPVPLYTSAVMLEMEASGEIKRQKNLESEPVASAF